MTDYIREAREKRKNGQIIFRDVSIDHILDQADALRERAEKAEAALPRWIPVEERLPDAGEPVIMWVRPEYLPGPIRGGTYNPVGDESHPWRDAWSLKDYKTSEIALWMPRPERPARDAGKDGEK